MRPERFEGRPGSDGVCAGCVRLGGIAALRSVEGAEGDGGVEGWAAAGEEA